MPIINKFGQRVKLVVTSTDAEKVLFESDSLRIDFDIRVIPDFTRAKIEIYNLATDTIQRLTTNSCFAEVYVALHDEEYVKLADKLFVSNAYEQTQVPNSVTTLFCYSSLKFSNTEKQLAVEVLRPSFRNTTAQVLQASGFNGEVEYIGYPSTFLDYVPPRNQSYLKGSAETLLKNLCGKHSNYYLEGNKVKFVYKVDSDNVSMTDFNDKTAYTLSTNNMRGQPVIGIASLKLSSNLDAELSTGKVVDITQLLTAAADNTVDLEVAQGILTEKVAQNSRYQIHQVQHKGSNWTGQWMTAATGISPSEGSHMSPHNWFN